MNKTALVLSLVLASLAASAPAQEVRKTPYWASISAGKAMMRTGPDRKYPAIWLYQRADLPIRVIEVYRNWRRVQDPEGATGWIQVQLLSAQRTALVTGDAPRPMHAEPDASSHIAYRAAPGVVGRISACKGGWCLLDVDGRRGYIQTGHFWGADRGEQL